MNKRELTQFANAAQKAIGLEHWDVDFIFTATPPDDKGLASAYDGGELGMCSVTDHHRMATIWVNPTDTEGEHSTKDTIVHELMHIYVAELGIDIDCQDWRCEAGINKLSPLIVAAIDNT